MMNAVYLRPLQIEDAQTSYRWRNDPEIWTFTGNKPTHKITKEIELLWLEKVLLRKDQLRFAICVLDTDQYIGNVQLLDITNQSAELHIFIGEKAFWGKKIGHQATSQILNYGFAKKKIQHIYLKVNPKNKSAITIYENIGFSAIGLEDNFIVMSLAKAKYLKVK